MASGLTPKGEALYHWDIYALLYAPQEVYFGHETQVNVNLIETVSLPDGSERVYLSPPSAAGWSGGPSFTLPWSGMGSTFTSPTS